MQGKDYHVHQAPVPFSKREITAKEMEDFKKASPLWAEQFPHIHTEEHLIKMGTLEAARNLVLGLDDSRDYYYILFRGTEMLVNKGADLCNLPSFLVPPCCSCCGGTLSDLMSPLLQGGRAS